jgi:hypothetical protein
MQAMLADAVRLMMFGVLIVPALGEVTAKDQSKISATDA